MFPKSQDAWTKYAEFEGALNEVERARTLFDLAINQEEIDMPEIVWKKYIDFEIGLAQGLQRPCELYEKLLERTQHVKVWTSYGVLLLN